MASNTKITAQEVIQIKNIAKLILADLENLRREVARDQNVGFTQEETLMRAGNESSLNGSQNFNQNYNNMFDASHNDKYKSKLHEIQKEKEYLHQQISEIQSWFGENVDPGSLKIKIEENYLKSQQLEIEYNKVKYEHSNLKDEKEKYKQKCSILESENKQLLAQNSWLEKEWENMKQCTISRDGEEAKINSLEKDISDFKKKTDAIIKEKNTKIDELEYEVIQLQKQKEIIDFEMVKQQRAYEAKLHNWEIKYKNDLTSLESSKIFESKPKKIIKSSLQDAKRGKKKGKEIKYHSDTESISDLPSKKLQKDVKKGKLAEFKAKNKLLEAQLVQNKTRITSLWKEISSLNQNLLEFQSENQKYQRQIYNLQEELQSVQISFERLKLDWSSANSESEELTQIKDDHAKLVVQNEWVIRQLSELKNSKIPHQKFCPTESEMNIISDIEKETKQLEQKYQEELSILSLKLNSMNEEHQKLLSQYSNLKVKYDKQIIETKDKNDQLEKQTNEVHLLRLNIKEAEREHAKNLEVLKTEIETIKESNKNVINLYENQNLYFKERVVKEIEFIQSQGQNSDLKGDSERYANLLSELAQRDAVWQMLKDENKQFKIKNSKLKSQQKEIKVKQIKEVIKGTPNNQNLKFGKISIKKNKAAKSPVKAEKETDILESQEDLPLYDTKDCQTMLTRLALCESENIKLSSKFIILSKNRWDPNFD